MTIQLSGDGFFKRKLFGQKNFAGKVIIANAMLFRQSTEQNLAGTTHHGCSKRDAMQEGNYRGAQKVLTIPPFPMPLRAITDSVGSFNIILSVIVNDPGEPLQSVQEDRLYIFKSEVIRDRRLISDKDRPNSSDHPAMPNYPRHVSVQAAMISQN
jgi:hypothetical protein